MTEWYPFSLPHQCGNKLVLNYLALAIHRTNIGKEHLIKVYLERDFNRPVEKPNRTGAIVPTSKLDAIARVGVFLRGHSALAATVDTCCHSFSFKDKCGPDCASSAEKLCESVRALHPEDMEGWDRVLKTS